MEEPYILSNGRPRPADVRIFESNWEKWVSLSDRPRGISTFDAPGVQQGNDWSYYCKAAGTVLPTGRAIVRDEFDTHFAATRYTIAGVRHATGDVQAPSRPTGCQCNQTDRLMEIADTWAPLLVSTVRDAVLYQEGLLRSETLRNRSDYEEHLVQLSQFFEYVKDEYSRTEAAAGMPLERLLGPSDA